MIGTRGLPASYGGVEVAVEQLSRELVKRGNRVCVYGRSAYCDPALEDMDGVEQITLPQINTKHLEAITHTMLATGHAIRRQSFDVIHFHATGPTMLSLATRALRVPTVATVHGVDWRREKWGLLARQMLRLAARVAATVPDRTIAVSQELSRFLDAQYKTSTTYIPNGVNLSSLADQAPVDGLEPGRFALHLGRIVPENRAFKQVDTDCVLAIVGPSSHSDAYVEEVQDLAANDPRVMLLGPRYGAEKAWLLQNAAVFVQPSTLEGLPITVLEALALSQRTIVSDIPENVEAVTFAGERPYGLVFRTGDIDDLAHKLSLALGPESQAVQHTLQIDRLVRERYDWGQIASDTEAVYREAIGDRVPARKMRPRALTGEVSPTDG